MVNRSNDILQVVLCSSKRNIKLNRYLMKRGYGQPHEKDSGGSDDDDMSDEGTDTDTLPSTSRHD